MMISININNISFIVGKIIMFLLQCSFMMKNIASVPVLDALICIIKFANTVPYSKK